MKGVQYGVTGANINHSISNSWGGIDVAPSRVAPFEHACSRIEHIQFIIFRTDIHDPISYRRGTVNPASGPIAPFEPACFRIKGIRKTTKVPIIQKPLSTS